jgi:hypothetical protein
MLNNLLEVFLIILFIKALFICKKKIEKNVPTKITQIKNVKYILAFFFVKPQFHSITIAI